MHVDQFLNLKERIESLYEWMIEEEIIPPWSTKREAVEKAAQVAQILDMGDEKSQR